MENEKINNGMEIKELKSEIFDLMREQEILNSRISELQKVKIEKLNKLQELEK